MIVVAIVVVLLIAAWWMDHRARRNGSRVRKSGEMLGRRYEQRTNLRATPPAMLEGSEWDKPIADKLKDPNHGGM